MAREKKEERLKGLATSININERERGDGGREKVILSWNSAASAGGGGEGGGDNFKLTYYGRIIEMKDKKEKE